MAYILQDADLKRAVPMFNSIPFSLFDGALRVAERDYLKPLLGDAEYANQVAAAGSAAGTDLALYNELKYGLAHITVYLAIPDLDIDITTHGLNVSKSDTHAPASQKRVENLQLSQLSKAMSEFDGLLSWLEANKTTYTDWASGSGYTEFKQGFVNTTAQFQEFVDIGSSRYLFMKLRPFRTKIERTELKRVMGDALYAEVQAQIVAGSITTDNTALLPFIREAVSCRAITQGIVGLNLQLNEQGYLVHGVQESTSMNLKKQADNNHIDGMVRQWNQDADAAFGALREYLNTNASATKYAVYFSSTLYVSATSSDPDSDKFSNDAGATSFVFS